LATRTWPGPGVDESQASARTTARKKGVRTRRDIEGCSGEDVAAALSQGFRGSGKKTAVKQLSGNMSE